jgi:hypothetical protein
MSIINKVVAKIVGSHNDRLIKKLSKVAKDNTDLTNYCKRFW